MKYEKEFRSYFSKVQAFTFKDATRFLKKLGASDYYIKLFIHLQKERHGLLRIGKGHYTYIDDDAVIGFAFGPFYYGMEHALTIHKLWTQMTNPVIVTTRKIRPGTRSVMGHNVIVRRISKQMFFGITYVKYGRIFVPVSDIEKTLIDFVYFKISISDDEMERILRCVDLKKLRNYTKLCNDKVKKQIIKILAMKSYGSK